MVLTMQVRFLFCIYLSACHGFLLTNKTGIPSVGTSGLTDYHYLMLTDALGVQKQLLSQMETFVLQLQNQLKTVNQEVKDLKSGNSATQSLAVATLKNESSTQSLAVATLKNESAAQSLYITELKKELREQNTQLKSSHDILQMKFDTIENENNVLKHDNAVLKSQITDLHNMSIHTKQELDSFTHSVAASNIQNVTTIQSGMVTLTSQMKNLNSRLNGLASTSTSRSQDFLALLNKTETIDSWSKSFKNYTEIQLVLLESHANSSNHRLDLFEQNYALDGNSTKNKFYSLEQNYASMSSEIGTLKGKAQNVNQPVALTSCGVTQVDYIDGEIMKFANVQTSIGINNLADFKNTGKFTCDKSGVYLFSASITYNGHSTADFTLNKNNERISYVMIVSGTNSGDYFSGSGTVVVHMNTGDILFAGAFRNMKVDSGHSCFTVIKIN